MPGRNVSRYRRPRDLRRRRVLPTSGGLRRPVRRHVGSAPLGQAARGDLGRRGGRTRPRRRVRTRALDRPPRRTWARRPRDRPGARLRRACPVGVPGRPVRRRQHRPDGRARRLARRDPRVVLDDPPRSGPHRGAARRVRADPAARGDAAAGVLRLGVDGRPVRPRGGPHQPCGRCSASTGSTSSSSTAVPGASTARTALSSRGSASTDHARPGPSRGVIGRASVSRVTAAATVPRHHPQPPPAATAPGHRPRPSPRASVGVHRWAPGRRAFRPQRPGSRIDPWPHTS